MMSNLPRDLVEEILSRVPWTRMKAVRATCKNWNVVSKNRSFAIKHTGRAASGALREREFLMITRDSRVELTSVNLHGIGNNVDLSIKRKGTLVSQDNSGQALKISHVFNCNGLLALLCTSINSGYDKSSGSHIILKMFNRRPEIYDLESNSSSWKALDAALDRNIKFCAEPGVSLKGNTYWFVRDNEQNGLFLLCFDFTRKRYGPLLPLPSHCDHVVDMSLTTVREEKLAVFLELVDAPECEIWVTSKIEPDAVLWSCFLKVSAVLLSYCFEFGNFFIDEEKKVAVVLDENNGFSYRRASIFGENGFVRRVDLRMSPYTRLWPLLCSYVPSCVQIK
ncbi:unnamed protein product [Microthlaspi erraticum]|uniref:F-box domain-containing protein n=1 Tax=Microthlaspi erraticum TaxID=1685480 RepID=A0A6D2HIR6_9BRAS|nr:unnamed protein product [Microthlaspi erraticum]